MEQIMKTEKNFWPLGIIAALTLFFGGTVALIVIACLHRSDLVKADYYDDEVRFQKQMDRVDRTRRLEANVHVTYDSLSRQIRVALQPFGGATHGNIDLYRPSAAGLDRTLDLKLDGNGVQTIDASDLRAGLWRVKISWKAGDEEYFQECPLIIPGMKS
jgi:hypothetical protein